MKLPRKVGHRWNPRSPRTDPAPPVSGAVAELNRVEVDNAVADKLTTLPAGTQKLFLGNLSGDSISGFRNWCHCNARLITLYVANRLELDINKDRDDVEALAVIVEKQFIACAGREFAGLSRELKSMDPHDRQEHLKTLEESSPLRDRIAHAFRPEQAIRGLMQSLARLTDDQIVSPST